MSNATRNGTPFDWLLPVFVFALVIVGLAYFFGGCI